MNEKGNQHGCWFFFVIYDKINMRTRTSVTIQLLHMHFGENI